MSNLRKNISRSEIACKCGCGFDTLDVKTADIVQGACDHFSKKLGHTVHLYISSGCRCDYWNTHEKGSFGSQHMAGRAIDHSILNISVKELYDYYYNLFPDMYGMGLYIGFVHLDTRSGEMWRRS